MWVLKILCSTNFGSTSGLYFLILIISMLSIPIRTHDLKSDYIVLQSLHRMASNNTTASLPWYDAGPENFFNGIDWLFEFGLASLWHFLSALIQWLAVIFVSCSGLFLMSAILFGIYKAISKAMFMRKVQRMVLQANAPRSNSVELEGGATEGVSEDCHTDWTSDDEADNHKIEDISSL